MYATANQRLTTAKTPRRANARLALRDMPLLELGDDQQDVKGRGAGSRAGCAMAAARRLAWDVIRHAATDAVSCSTRVIWISRVQMRPLS